MKLMDGIWGQGRARGYAVTGLLAVVVFGGTATAADVLRSASDQQPAGDVFVTPTDSPTATPTPSAESTPTVAQIPPSPVPVQAPAAAARPATVNAVTQPAPQAPAAPNTDPAVGTVGDDGRYTPAPVQPKAGEPPVLPDPGSEPAPPMRGEPGYVPPAG